MNYEYEYISLSDPLTESSMELVFKLYLPHANSHCNLPGNFYSASKVLCEETIKGHTLHMLPFTQIPEYPLLCMYSALVDYRSVQAKPTQQYVHRAMLIAHWSFHFAR
jgi:hypothetical protein